MIAHLVLFRFKADLSPADRKGLIEAMRHAFASIPEVRRVRIGRRRVLGRTYDALVKEHFEHVAVLEFDTEEALVRYLDHPAHAELSRRFCESSEAALAYDFEIVVPERVGEWK